MLSYSFRSRRSVAWAAFRSGGLSSCVLRPSSGSPSRWVVVCRFRTAAAAAQFARVAAAFSGCPISVKECMSVSVPVFVAFFSPGWGGAARVGCWWLACLCGIAKSCRLGFFALVGGVSCLLVFLRLVFVGLVLFLGQLRRMFVPWHPSRRSRARPFLPHVAQVQPKPLVIAPHLPTSFAVNLLAVAHLRPVLPSLCVRWLLPLLPRWFAGPFAPALLALLPGTRWQSCGSGSWSELALAVGLGVPVFVFEAPVPASWGKWSQVESGFLSGSWVLHPAQFSLL